MGGLLQDFRFGLRALRASPAFVVLAVLCFGVGTGAIALTFTVVNDALLKPLGSLDATGLVAIGEVRASAPGQWWPASRANLLDWRSATSGRAELGALRGASFVVGAGGTTSRVDGAYATGNFFAVLGVTPLLGRVLEPGDEAAEGSPVVVLGETQWRREFGADTAVLGRAVQIDGVAHTVVGVVPALLDVGMPAAIRSALLWVPLREGAGVTARGDRALLVVARMTDGAGTDGLAAQLKGVASRLAAEHPEDAGWSIAVARFGESAIGVLRQPLLTSLGAAALVLLIACANLASLTLAQAARRRHEFAIRTAIGASPWRIVRQLLCESLLIAALGAALGLVLARTGLDALVRSYEAETLAPAVLPLDGAALLVTIGIAFVATMLFGLWPAWDVARGAARARLAESGAGSTPAHGRGVLRRGLVAGQVAASLVLLVGASLLSRSFLNLLTLDGGVDTQRVTSVRVESQGAPVGLKDVARFTGRIIDALAGLPGIESVASANNLLPLRGGGQRSTASVPGEADSGAKHAVAYVGVTANFFETLGVPILRGRVFGENEQRGRLAVVNERMARELWPSQDPIGRQFRLDADPDRGVVTVVGVSRDVLTWDSNRDEPLPTAYLDFASFPYRPVFFFLRTRSAQQGVSPEGVYRGLDSLGFPIRRIAVTPMTQVAQAPFWRQRLFSLWFAIFGAAAIVLTVAGIYGVLTQFVGQRGHEIGVRMALGAQRRDVLVLILREGALFVGGGLVVGTGVAYAVARALRGLLFGVEPVDVPLFAVAAVVLATVAMAASLVPAVRAVRVDPRELLRR